ncbi:hypothetical protein EDD85DRAFT_939870 [Armillaria nabsnona]|nr:hypothetical protein EDD85DRAFT_939870 [Armillaria nabsnona]
MTACANFLATPGSTLGIHVILAAGNDNTYAPGISPARAAAAITVGATSVADGRVSFPITDIFARDQYITSSWTGGTNRTNISRTSMAVPPVLMTNSAGSTTSSAKGNIHYTVTEKRGSKHRDWTEMCHQLHMFLRIQGRVLSLNLVVELDCLDLSTSGYDRNIIIIIFTYDRQEPMRTALDVEEWMYCVD